MADEFRAAVDAEQIEFKAFARHFEHPGENEEERKRSVLYVIATLTYPDSGWNVIVVQQEGEPDTWRLLEDAPSYRDQDRTYYIAAGTTEHEIEKVPQTVRVIVGTDQVHRVPVENWD